VGPSKPHMMRWEQFIKLPSVDLRIGPERKYVRVPRDHLSYIDRAIEHLNELVLMHTEEHARVGTTEFSDDPPLVERYHRRETICIGAFLCFAVTTEGIIRRHFQIIADELLQWFPVAVNVDAILEEMKTRMADIERPRHKVFAHTAFGDPRKDDNEAMLLAALSYFTSSIMTRDDDGRAVVGGDIAFVGIPGQQAVLPAWKMLDLAEVYSKHVLRWWEHFRELMRPVASLTRAQILAVRPDAVEMYVCGFPAK
jgi:hypothetical protein